VLEGGGLNTGTCAACTTGGGGTKCTGAPSTRPDDMGDVSFVPSTAPAVGLPPQRERPCGSGSGSGALRGAAGAATGAAGTVGLVLAMMLSKKLSTDIVARSVDAAGTGGAGTAVGMCGGAAKAGGNRPCACGCGGGGALKPGGSDTPGGSLGDIPGTPGGAKGSGALYPGGPALNGAAKGIPGGANGGPATPGGYIIPGGPG